jgi:surface protein
VPLTSAQSQQTEVEDWDFKMTVDTTLGDDPSHKYRTGSNSFRLNTACNKNCERKYSFDVYTNGTLKEKSSPPNSENLLLIFESPGVYEIYINGKFPYMHYPTRKTITGWETGEGFGDQLKIVSANFSGNNTWKTFNGMFQGAENLKNVSGNPNFDGIEDMSFMFYGARSFNDNLSSWNVSNVDNMNYLFAYARDFNGSIGAWDVSSVGVMDSTFLLATSFNRSINSWDVSNVYDMRDMFFSANSFNRDISSWDTSNVRFMESMFNGASNFTRNLSSWDVSNVRKMDNMFWAARNFNGDLSGWDVSNVENMQGMFQGTDSFNQDLNSWDVSNVETMQGMFSRAKSFNGDISEWDVSNVDNMAMMFNFAEDFNRDISEWDVSNVENMGGMFRYAESFNQDLSEWCPKNTFSAHNSGIEGDGWKMPDCGDESGSGDGSEEDEDDSGSQREDGSDVLRLNSSRFSGVEPVLWFCRSQGFDLSVGFVGSGRGVGSGLVDCFVEEVVRGDVEDGSEPPYVFNTPSVNKEVAAAACRLLGYGEGSFEWDGSKCFKNGEAVLGIGRGGYLG